MRTASRQTRCWSLPAGLICATGLVVLAASPVRAGERAGACRGGPDASCICWTEDGVTKMSCPPDPVHAEVAGPSGNRRVAPLAVDAPVPTGKPRVERLPPDATLSDVERRAYLQKRQETLDNDLLAAQRARFVAKARGESAAKLERLDRTFTDLNALRRANLTELRVLDVAQ